MILVGALAVILPISMAFWAVTVLSVWYSESSEYDIPTPMRWFICLSLPLSIAVWGYRKRSLDISGAVSGFFVGFFLTLGNYCFIASLMTFFVTSSKATKYKGSIKRKFDAYFKEGGQRNWVQVLCNGGVATELALLYMVENGVGEKLIDFRSNFQGSWLALGVLSAISAASGDTLASELGAVWSTGKPYLITTLQIVPKGTNGGVSLPGLFFSALGGCIVGISYYITLILCVSKEILNSGPSQWPIIIVGTLAGFLGSLFDSVLGATLQYSGEDVKTGQIVEQPGPGVRHISGSNFLDNHSVNLLTTVVTGFFMPQIAVSLWTLLK